MEINAMSKTLFGSLAVLGIVGLGTALGGCSKTETAGVTEQGKQAYTSVCATCHAQGVGGAPKFGDKAAWGPRIEQGKETLYKHAIQGFQGGKGAMPPKGGNPSLSDEDVKAAVDYMMSQAQ
jgi:cytochrome c5